VTRSAVADLPDEAGSWLALVEALPPGDPERLAATRRGLEWAPPDRWSFLSAYSDELRYRGDLDGATAALVELAAALPGEYTVQREVAQKLRWLGRPDDALRYANRATELAPGNDLAHAERATTLGALGRYADALDAASTVTDADPDFAHNWKLLAEHAYLAGRPDVAAKAAQRAEALGDSHYAAEATAYAAWASGDLPAARNGFTRALEHEPSCCCAQVDAALVSGAATAPLFAGPAEAERTGRCTNQSCWRRSVS
jgi:tetratricopeptide (TPR) repeat protein